MHGMRITDFHSHAFPDALADRAMAALLAETTDVTAYHDGRLSSLLESMDKAGIDRAVICSIATRPEQFDKILAWSESIRSERIEPFPSVHPQDPDVPGHIAAVAAAGLKGIKLHPYYQDFDLDDEAAFPIYEALCEHDLILVCHTGFDIAFPRIRRCDPGKIVTVLERYPGLKFVSTHFGSWEDWDEVEAHLAGKPIYMEISYSLQLLGRERARNMFLNHPRSHMLFGTDSPWQDQSETLGLFRALDLGEEWERAVLSENAERLLG